MARKKLYFGSDFEGEEPCYPIEHWLKHMVENSITKMDVFEAKICRGSGYFYCREYFEVGTTEGCGKDCEGYSPRNGKSGICKNYGYLYEAGKLKEIVIKSIQIK